MWRRAVVIRRLCASATQLKEAAAEAAMRARRQRRERVDSVDSVTLADREAHLELMAEARIDPQTLAEVRSLRLGRTKQWQHQKRADQRRITIAQQQMGFTQLLGRTSVGMHHDWDRLNREGLPEVALLGHSNCGKSALLNALAGTHARRGPAAVSARAGWTADLGFYRTRPKVPTRALAPSAHAQDESGEGMAMPDAERQRARARGSLGLILVDTPGYGFAVGDKQQLLAWGALLADYLEHSQRLRLGLLLVDATRGLCTADARVLRRVLKAGVPVLSVLTKTDLLLPDDLAASHAVVRAQLAQAAPAGTGVRAPPLMLSAHFLTGVANMWRVLLRTLAEIENAEYAAALGRELPRADPLCNRPVL